MELCDTLALAISILPLASLWFRKNRLHAYFHTCSELFWRIGVIPTAGSSHLRICDCVLSNALNTIVHCI